ncbi:MAG: hypothetical protein V2A34_11690 [Lentisphaerota bacterium]
MQLMNARRFCLAAGLVAAMTTGCATYDAAVTRPDDPLGKVAPRMGFNTHKTQEEIDRFLAARTGPSGLLASFGQTSPYMFSTETGRFHVLYYGKMGYLDDQAFSYDLALACIGFLLNGQPAQAEKILDALEKDFYLLKNGSFGLYNSYLVSSRIPVEDLSMGGDGDRMHAGPLLWVAISALNHAKIQRTTRYLEFTLDMVNWCRTQLTYYRFPDGERGAISMGMGWGPDWTKIFSTEHNIDYFAVLQMLHSIYAESGPEVREIFNRKRMEDAWLRDEMDHVGRWLKDVAFNPETYCFRAGVNEFGADNLKILDGTSWGLGGVGPENFAAWGIDLDRLIESAEKLFSSRYTLPNGKGIDGFDITDVEGYEHQREPLVWFEGTGQQIIAFAELARYFARKGDLERARKYSERAVHLTQNMWTFSSFFNLNGSLPYMAIRPETNTIVKTLKWEWEIPRGKDDQMWVGSLSSTMWFLYCVHGFYNPMKWM